MIRAVAWLSIICLLGGCGSDPRGTKLANVDLGDPETIQRIRIHLSANDRGAFNDYVFRHYAASRTFCGRALIRPDGKSPETIGEAIDLTLARDAEERQARNEASRPSHPRELAKKQWDDLTSERDMLIDAQSSLREKHGSSAERLSEWASTNARLTDLNRRLIALKPQVFGPVSDASRRP